MKTRSIFLKMGIVTLSIGFVFSLFACAMYPSEPAAEVEPLYVFFFIGDGMASAQIHAAEAYLAATAKEDAKTGVATAGKLSMSAFPVLGMQTSFANNRFITGSAAAGTALACGQKTNIGVVAMNPAATRSYTSLAEAAKAKGMKVGIVSSVSLDHATPAVFYAHSARRDNYEKIGEALLESGFDYFAGGGFRVDTYTSDTYLTLDDNERVARIESQAKSSGFSFSNSRLEFNALSEDDGRVIAINPHLDTYKAMPFELNRKTENDLTKDYRDSISLAEFTQKGIDLMKHGKYGFFMMVEGGKIDWACHANDARAAIEETIAFDKAVDVAVQFAKQYPERTLILVTGDHECGGLALGYAGLGYDTDFEKLKRQSLAYDDFGRNVLAAYTSSHMPAPEQIDADMWQIILETYGMDGDRLTAQTQDDLTPYEIGLLEDAFDLTMGGNNANSEQENNLLYGRNEPLTVALTHLLNRKSGLSWTSFSHTAVPVPVFAMGHRSEMFDGYYDNTQVARNLAKIMQVNIGG